MDESPQMNHEIAELELLRDKDGSKSKNIGSFEESLRGAGFSVKAVTVYAVLGRFSSEEKVHRIDEKLAKLKKARE